MMKDLIEGFPEQLRDAVKIAQSSQMHAMNVPLKNVLITGLGGSGIGGTIAAELSAKNAVVPVVVSKGYFIPGWVNEHTLVIVSSFSGNTEETIHAMELAMARKAKMVCVTSGGKIAETARKEGYDLIVLPPGNSPRACLGYSLVQLMQILFFHQVISINPLPDFLSAATLLESERENIHREAKELASFFKGKIPVIYSTTYREGVAIRLRQQINENAKMLCWHHVIPEMNHNELVGWREKNESLAVLYLRDDYDFMRNQKRIDINKEIISGYTSNVLESWAKGDNAIEKTIWHIHLGDWISWYLSVERKVDAVEVKIIDFLKGELSKF